MDEQIRLRMEEYQRISIAARASGRAREARIRNAQLAEMRAERMEWFTPSPPPYPNVGVSANRWTQGYEPSIGELLAAERSNFQYQAPIANRWTNGYEPSIGELIAADRLNFQYQAPIVHIQQQAPPEENPSLSSLILEMNAKLDKQAEELRAMRARLKKQEVQIEIAKDIIQPPPSIQPKESFTPIDQVKVFIECTTITAQEVPCLTYELAEEPEVIEEVNEEKEEAPMATLTMRVDDDPVAFKFFSVVKEMSFPEYGIPDEAKKGHAVKYSPFEEPIKSFEFKPGWLFGEVKNGAPTSKQGKPPDRKRRALIVRSNPVVKKIKRMKWLEVLLSKPP